MAERGKDLRINVLGVGISVLNLTEATHIIAGSLRKKPLGYVCVTGVHGVIESQRDVQLRAILNRAFLNTPDGMPMVWLGQLRGHHDMGRVYGPDLMLALMALSPQYGLRHFLFGGAQGVAEVLRHRLMDRFPGLLITGVYEPPFRPLLPAEERALADQVEQARPDIFWVGLSTPKQERFMAQFHGRLGVPLMIGVGAAFDFHAGRVRQAPVWMQRSGLEWLFRLWQEPQRLWRRYLKNNPLFGWLIFCQWTGLKKYRLED